MQTYSLKLELKIDWSELDLFGHVNNVSFFKYMQAARVNLWNQVGLTKLYKETKKGAILASTACQFKKPLFFPGDITIFTEVSFIKTTSFGLRHHIIDHHQLVSAIGEDVIVMYDFNMNEKLPLSESLKNLLQNYSKPTENS